MRSARVRRTCGSDVRTRRGSVDIAGSDAVVQSNGRRAESVEAIGGDREGTTRGKRETKIGGGVSDIHT